MDSKETTGKEASQKAQLAQINKALAVFLLFFSAVVVIAVFFTETWTGKLANLAAGLILAVIAVVLILMAKKNPEKL
jgi:membrane protein YdbS with pleckstrin-like domain